LGWRMAFKRDFKKVEDSVIFRNLDLKHMYWRQPRCGSSKKERLPVDDDSLSLGNPEVESWFTMADWNEIRDVKGKPIIFFDLDWDKASRDDAKILGLPRGVMARRGKLVYTYGWKYCSLCGFFYKTEATMCPIHGKPLRTKPRGSNNKANRYAGADRVDPEDRERDKREIEEFIKKHGMLEKTPRNLVGTTPPHRARDLTPPQRDQRV